MIKFIPNPSSIFSELEVQLQSNCYWVVDTNTLEYCLPLINSADDKNIIVLPTGEAHKSIETTELIWEFLTKHGANRNSTVINLGGGILCDTAGFAASVYQRGISFNNIPTTLLAMVDAAHGGKTGVDFRNLKNYLGTFTEAEQVIICPEFLKTLSTEELKNGWAEILKHGLVADRDYFEVAKTSFKTTSDFIPSLEIIQRSVQIKQDIVCEDPFESGKRKLLNFGHTIGHAIESFFLEKGQTISHGRAVAAGMFAESFISTRKWGLRLDELILISHALEPFMPLQLHEEDIIRIVSYALKDKKNDEQIRLTLLSEIGKGYPNIPVDEAIISESLQQYLLWQRKR